MHADPAAVERVREKAGRKGVEVLPPWLVYHDGVWSGYHEEECDQPCPGVVMWLIDPLTVPFIVTGSLSAWLAGRGIAVYAKLAGGLLHRWVSMRPGTPTYSGPVDLGPDATDHLSALLSATLTILESMPDAETK